MKYISHYNDAKEYTTKDGSIIRELMHPEQHACKNQSFAEARIPCEQETRAHKHLISEEIYYINQGTGRMTLGDKIFDVNTGDTICIPQGATHKIKNTGDIELKIICCCSPEYSHEDTILA
jgi:mannose-6-phosphate isomerase-like protein (cupin superfamily)